MHNFLTGFGSAQTSHQTNPPCQLFWYMQYHMITISSRLVTKQQVNLQEVPAIQLY